MKDFLWTPGDGYSKAAVKRMQIHLSLPAKPMGEAWFMGDDRLMFDYLYGDIKQMPIVDAIKALEDIITGTCYFGEYDEWNSWYHYLLGQLVPRSHEKPILQQELLTIESCKL